MMAVTFRRFMCVPEAAHKSEAELRFRLRAVQLQTRHAAFLEAWWGLHSLLPFSLPERGCQRAGRWGILWRSKGAVNAEMKPWREHSSLIHGWMRASASYTRPETRCGSKCGFYVEPRRLQRPPRWRQAGTSSDLDCDFHTPGFPEGSPTP